MTTLSTDYDLFLSHASEDTTWCVRLAQRLKGEGVRVWFDEWEIQPADNIVAKINDGLSRSRQMAAVWRCNYFATHKQWTDAEIATRQYADVLGEKRLLIPLPREGHCQPPPLLAPLKSIDFTDDNRFDERIAILLRVVLDASARSVAPATSTPSAAAQQPPPRSEDPFQKWLEFIASVVLLVVVFLGMLGFGAFLVQQRHLFPGVGCVGAGFLAAVSVLCWILKRNHHGDPVARQEFAFAQNATEQLSAHYRSAQSAR
jgi:TIR domain-containing protein